MKNILLFFLNHRENNTFSAQLLKAFLPLTIIPVLCSGIIFYMVCYDSILSNSIAVSHEITDYATDEMDNLLKTTENIASSLMRSSELQIAMRYKTDSGDTNLISPFHINSSLNAIKNSTSMDVLGIYCLGLTGRFYQSNTTSESRGFYQDTSWYQTVINTDGSVWFPPHRTSFVKHNTHMDFISYGIPFTDYITHEPIGIILIEIDAAKFFNALTKSDSIQSNTYHVVDRYDHVLFTTDSDYQGCVLNLSSMESSSFYTRPLANGWKTVGIIEKNKVASKALVQLSVLLLLVLAGCVVIAVFFSVLKARQISEPLQFLVQNMKIVQKGNYDVELPLPDSTDEMVALYRNFNKMIVKSNQYIDEIKKEQVELRIANFKALQAQINPHFLYNTMDTIAWNIRLSNNEKALETLMVLTKFFRSILQQGSDISSLGQEFEQVSLYLQIQLYRYDDVLDYSVDCADELKHYIVPKLILQPIVENAIYHGIKNKGEEHGHISVQTKIHTDYYVVEITDNGLGMPPHRLQEINHCLTCRLPIPSKSGGYGIYNVNERIKIYFGAQYGLYYYSKSGSYTRAVIKLPYKLKEEDVL